MCETVVDDSAIGCDRCNAWFCPSEMCTGLADNAIALISSLREENSVLFVCSGCRVIPGAGAWTEVPNTRSRKSKEKEKENETVCVKQLYLTVKGLCSEMAKLTAKLDAAIGQNSLGSSAPPPQPTPSERTVPTLSSRDFPALPPRDASVIRPSADQDYRKVIRQEVIEAREREKRRCSEVIKGLVARTADAISAEFAELSTVMMGVRVSLTDIVKIKDHPELCRAKIMDNELRALVLDKAKFLKGSQYDHVYIRRDLTFTQRQELNMRRQQQPTSRVFTASVPRPHGGAEAQRKSAEVTQVGSTPEIRTESNQQAAPAREPPVSGTDTEATPTASALRATETQNSVGAPATTRQPEKLGDPSPSLQHTVIKCCIVNVNGICSKMTSLLHDLRD